MAIWDKKKLRGTTLSSFRHDKERMTRRRRILGFIVVLALTVFLFRTPVEGVLSSVFHVVFRPVFVVKEHVRDAFSSMAYVFSSRKNLSEENARLNDALDLVTLEGYSREILRKENEQLKLMLGREVEHDFVLTRVLASVGVTPYDTLVIDVGRDDAVGVGMRVYADGDFVLGEVSQVFARSAVVTLYSSSGNQLSAFIGATSTPTTAFGIGGGNFRSVLPKGVEVFVGDLVEIPSLTQSFIGKVEAVVKSEQSSLQEVYYQFPVSVYALRNLYVAVPRTEVATDNER